MKISKLALPMVCLCSLTACGSKTSMTAFKEAADKIEYHIYKRITLKYFNEEDNVKTEAQYSFKYNKDKDIYASESEETVSTFIRDVVTKSNIKQMDFGDDIFDSYEYWAKRIDENAKIKKEINYYVNPFKVTANFAATYNSDEYDGETKIDIKLEFNKYGDMTNYDYSYRDDYKKIEKGCKTVTKNYTRQKMKLSYEG